MIRWESALNILLPKTEECKCSVWSVGSQNVKIFYRFQLTFSTRTFFLRFSAAFSFSIPNCRLFCTTWKKMDQKFSLKYWNNNNKKCNVYLSYPWSIVKSWEVKFSFSSSSIILAGSVVILSLEWFLCESLICRAAKDAEQLARVRSQTIWWDIFSLCHQNKPNIFHYLPLNSMQITAITRKTRDDARYTHVASKLSWNIRLIIAHLRQNSEKRWNYRVHQKYTVLCADMLSLVYSEYCWV